MVDGGELFVVTEVATGKVKRIRNNPTVVVTVCDLCGRTAPGASSAAGTARLLDDRQMQAARALLACKYRLSRLGNWLAGILHIRRRSVVGIAVRL